MTLTPEMARAGVTPQLLSSTHRFTCPRCGKEFSLFQSRAIACKYCPKADQNCPNVRCPHCDKEYPIRGFIVPDNNPGAKADQVHMTNYAQTVFNRFSDSYNRR